MYDQVKNIIQQEDDCSSIPGPRNWQPRVRTAAHKFADNCWGFWWAKINSVTALSPRLLAARVARDRPSSSTSWQLMSVTSFRCIGLLKTQLEPVILVLLELWICGCKLEPGLPILSSDRSSWVSSSSCNDSLTNKTLQKKKWKK